MSKMRLSLFKRRFAILMAFLVLLTTTGFSMNIHFCGGHLQDISFYSDQVECSMMAEMEQAPACPMHALAAGNTCCKDQDLSIEPDAPETVLLTSVNHEITWMVVQSVVQTEQASPIRDARLESYTTYRPPPIDRNIPVLVQSFRL